MMRMILLILLGLLMGCQESLDGDPLVQADQWRLTEFHPRLWRGNPTPVGVCDTAIGMDRVSGVNRLKADLTDCPQLTLVQPTGHDLAAGETIELDFYHFASTVEGVGDARVVVAIGDERVMDRTIEVLGGSASLQGRFVIDNRVPEGTPIHILMADPGDSAWVLMHMGRAQDRPPSGVPQSNEVHSAASAERP